jgi:hypothetical protein
MLLAHKRHQRFHAPHVSPILAFGFVALPVKYVPLGCIPYFCDQAES